MRMADQRTATVFVRNLAWLLAYCFSMLGITSADTPDEKPVSRVFKLNHLAVILPELPIVRESWGGDCQLWTPTVPQVAAAESAVLRRIEEAAHAGAKVDPKAKYLIQYYGVVLKAKKWIVCQAWRTESLRKDPDMEFDKLLEALFTQSYSCIEEPSETEPAGHLELYYDPSAARLSDHPADSPHSPRTDCRAVPSSKKTSGEHEARRKKPGD